jgi:hypothetical protein|tara:strand:- start:208 stop:453 length:246 start_codon:yes stop_codon:yes gene_type:complete
MPYGYKYPADNEIYKGKIKQGDLSDVPDGKLYREGLNMNPNQKVKQGDLGSESGSVGKKEKVDASIFKNDNNPTNKKVKGY